MRAFLLVFMCIPLTLWAKDYHVNYTQAELKKKLTPLQYMVTQKGATERAFSGNYWNNHQPGIYVDIVSGEPLFSSTDKFNSGTGWPSFTKPIDKRYIVTRTDRTFFLVRTEVLSKYGKSHLGHLFDDGPPPTNMRYCMNSAALRFVPLADMKKEGYGQYLKLFNKAVVSKRSKIKLAVGK